MSSIHQPEITNDHGVICTIGMRVNDDRCAIVMPFATDNTTLDGLTLCSDMCLTAITHIITSLTAMMSEDAWVAFVQSEGMIDGRIPFRIDFAPADHPGTLTGNPVSSQVCGLCVWYEDPEDVEPGKKMAIAKNFIPGIPGANVTGNSIDPAVVETLQALCDTSQAGYETTAGSGKWYRMLSAPYTIVTDGEGHKHRVRTPGTQIKRTTGQLAREVVYTQRRRLTPRP